MAQIVEFFCYFVMVAFEVVVAVLQFLIFAQPVFLLVPHFIVLLGEFNPFLSVFGLLLLGDHLSKLLPQSHFLHEWLQDSLQFFGQ